MKHLKLFEDFNDNFLKWFGNSKVVDDNNTPLKVYHGTTKDFSFFDFSTKGNHTKHRTSKMGFFFTDDSEVAHAFVGMSKNSQNIIPVYLSIENPKILTVDEFINIYDGEIYSKKIQKAGYDGVYIKGNRGEYLEEWRGDTWVVFKPTQIKSAIGNNGNFDPNNHMIIENI